ncbi:hypothetical protein ACIQYL_25400 [Lysinibacillus xylanilyticus]|uniref:hypothetical protein n=1 Tax=Lysinibacillus xylanilyticus TaxID=582475 RepID=UPI00381DB11C
MRDNILKLIDSNIPALQVSKATGIPQNTVYRIFKGEASLDNITLKNVELLNKFYEEVILMGIFKKAQELHQTFENILSLKSDARPFIFTHENDVIFNSNCHIGGAPRVWVEDNENCEVIFTNDDWNEATWGAESFEYEDLRVQAIKEAIESSQTLL